jgi:cellulose synthase/poly-beta-1,6-N-acetylglucosamine synthase-like glycosyltransferase
MTCIPVIVCAKNEERALGATLEALLAACDHAEARSAFTYDVRVVLDDTTDGSAAVARRHPRVTILESSGGKVEAQRTGLRAHAGAPAPFAIFCDADVRPSEDALHALSRLLETRPEIQVAMCPLRPLPPRRRTPLAAALHTYNLRRGFSSSRTWFNGKLFAMRSWDVPSRAALASRIAALPVDPFYDLSAGIVIDDIFLSRAVVLAHGPAALAETTSGEVLFRAPETWRGMHRYYRRMRRELERLDVLFPETALAQRRHGRRSADLLPEAPWRERVHHALFSSALVVCKAAYVAERAFVRHVRRVPRDPWPAIEETKAW